MNFLHSHDLKNAQKLWKQATKCKYCQNWRKGKKTQQDKWNSTSKLKNISNGGIVYQNLNEVLPKCGTFEPMYKFNLQNGLNYFVIEWTTRMLKLSFFIGWL